MTSRFADTTSVTRYVLTDGEDWVEFRDQLSYGETRNIEAAALRPTIAGGTDVDVAIDWSVYEVARLAAWCAAWSFTLKGKKTRPSRRMIDALDPDTVEELTKLLDTHLAREADPEGKAEPGIS